MTDIFVCGETLTIETKFSHTSLIQPNTSNYTLGLQMRWAMQQLPKLIVAQTMPTNRIEWVPEARGSNLISMPYDKIMTTAEPASKKAMMFNFCTNIMDAEMKHRYDMGLLQMWYLQAKHMKVRTLFVLDEEGEFLIPFLDDYVKAGDDVNGRIQEILCE